MDQIEAMLADDPDDSFLRYGLAMEHASSGDDETASEVLKDLIARSAANPYIPAFLMAGQMLARLGREGEAAEILRQGIVAAKKSGDQHAMGEMQGLLATVE
jgi:thioredoxin-like negative regulator of GroEL